MQVDYVRLQLSEDDSRTEWYNRRLPLWMLRKWWVQNQAVRTRFVYEGRFMGLVIVLPYTCEGILRVTAEELQAHIQQILIELNCSKSVILPEQKLWERMGYHPIVLQDCLIRMMLEEVVEYIRKYRGIRKKNLHILLWDREEEEVSDWNSQLTYMLNVLLPELNRMTIVTDRPNQMEPYIQHTYESTGLIIETMSQSMQTMKNLQFMGKIHDMIWVDMGKLRVGYYEQADEYEESKVTFNDVPAMELSGMQVLIEGNCIEQQLLGQFLLSKLDRDWCTESISQIKKQYHLTLGKISWKPKKYRIDNPL